MKICGRTHQEIRQAYFKHNLPKLLNEIQADQNWPKEEIESLGLYLESLRLEETKTIEDVAVFFKGKVLEEEPKPPTVTELVGIASPDDQAKLEAWQASVNTAKAQITKIRTLANTAVIQKKPISKDEWLDWALQIETLKRWLMEEAVWKEQLYRRELTRIKDSYGISRAEAEERAKITEQYRDYRNAQNEVDSLTEIVLLCKKRGSQDF